MKFTMYDLRGGWAEEKDKRIILKQLNKKLVEQREELIDKYENKMFPKALEMERATLRKKIAGMKEERMKEIESTDSNAFDNYHDVDEKIAEDDGYFKALNKVLTLLK